LSTNRAPGRTDFLSVQLSSPAHLHCINFEALHMVVWQIAVLLTSGAWGALPIRCNAVDLEAPVKVFSANPGISGAGAASGEA